MLPKGEHHLEVNGIRHWVRVAGVATGLPVVVVHGGPGGNNYNFERTIGPALEAFAPLVYYEQRGCGHSAKPAHPTDYSIELLVSDLRLLLLQLGLEQVVLLGFSFGGELSLEFVLRHPEQVAGLILQAPTVGKPEQIAAVQLEGFRSVARGEKLQAIEDILGQPLPLFEQLSRVWDVMDTPTVDRFLFQNQPVALHNRQLWRKSGLTNTGDMHRALAAQPRPSLLERAASISAPTLVAVGRHDRNVGLELNHELVEALSDARWVVFEDSAHFPEMEEPELYVQTVRDYYQGLGKDLS